MYKYKKTKKNRHETNSGFHQQKMKGKTGLDKKWIPLEKGTLNYIRLTSLTHDVRLICGKDSTKSCVPQPNIKHTAKSTTNNKSFFLTGK